MLPLTPPFSGLAIWHVKAAVQAHSHFTYNVLLYATVWWVLSKHDSISQSGNTLRIILHHTLCGSGISHHFFEHKVSRNNIEIAAAPADLHGVDHKEQFVVASQGGDQLPVNFCLLQICRHAMLHWSWRKQPQRIVFEITMTL